MVYLYNFIFLAIANKKYTESYHADCSAFGLFIYLCHDLWIHVICAFIIYPLKKKDQLNMGTFEIIVLVSIGVEILSYINYVVVKKLTSSTKKKDKKLSIKKD